jgi:phage host-nuclease inhibitor protein Gam
MDTQNQDSKNEKKNIIVVIGKVPKEVLIPKVTSLSEVTRAMITISAIQQRKEEYRLKKQKQINGITAMIANSDEEADKEIAVIFESIFRFAQENKIELTNHNRIRTIKLLTGRFGWRESPSSVHITNKKTVLESITKLKLERFIRYEPEINKEAILKEPEIAKTINGVSIKKPEMFFIKPTSINEEFEKRLTKVSEE